MEQQTENNWRRWFRFHNASDQDYIAVGVAVGVAIGAAINNIPVGIAVGIAIFSIANVVNRRRNG